MFFSILIVKNIQGEIERNIIFLSVHSLLFLTRELGR